MQGKTNTILFRHDTFFGVCEAIGQDFGFNPNWLRGALSASVLLNPLAVIGVYAGLGIAVGVSRWLFPAGRSAAAVATATVVAPVALEGANDAAPVSMTAAA